MWFLYIVTAPACVLSCRQTAPICVIVALPPSRLCTLQLSADWLLAFKAPTTERDVVYNNRLLRDSSLSHTSPRQATDRRKTGVGGGYSESNTRAALQMGCAERPAHIKRTSSNVLCQGVVPGPWAQDMYVTCTCVHASVQPCTRPALRAPVHSILARTRSRALPRALSRGRPSWRSLRVRYRHRLSLRATPTQPPGRLGLRREDLSLGELTACW